MKTEPVDVDRFWQVVELARVSAGPAADRARREGQRSTVTEALAVELTCLSLPEIVEFDQVFREVRDRADKWDACAACWIIEYGFLSDDGFSDFRAGLAGLGRSTFDAAVADPDSLARHPAVQEIAAASDSSRWIGDEELLFVANRVYEQLTDDAEAFWDAAEAVEVGTTRPTDPKPSGERWDLRDQGEWRRRLPKLGAMFIPQRLPAA